MQIVVNSAIIAVNKTKKEIIFFIIHLYAIDTYIITYSADSFNVEFIRAAAEEIAGYLSGWSV